MTMAQAGCLARGCESTHVIRNDKALAVQREEENGCQLVLEVVPRGLLQTTLNSSKTALESPARVGPDQTDGFPDMAMGVWRQYGWPRLFE